ncbi:flavin reductase family protein [Siculibacillus lacustris]|uniref:Flavin reductase family protein n=1 Tax=Siculibacillus lacustris TaxID=1549641 RepID=A0A4Q9VHJ9_9HYPH|nr:flavin reductase family protein [Siculibacillus lacustris]TBW34622.1 flavin reductase family protein [Siculibacillus lacustris]
MFYVPAQGHGLPHDPFKAICAPRPIGWISTRSASGAVNLAPYSFFTAVADTPPMVLFSSNGWKDSIAAATETGEFVVNLATWDLREAMNRSSAPLPRGVSEFAFAGLTEVASQVVAAPRVAEAAAALECRVVERLNPRTLAGTPSDNHMVIGQVVGVHLADSCMVDGLFDMTRARTLARCGYRDYVVVDQLFQMSRPPGAGGL